MPEEDAKTEADVAVPEEVKEEPKAKGEAKDPSKKPLTKAEKEAGAVRRSLTGIPLDADSHPVDVPKIDPKHSPPDELKAKAKADRGE